MNQFFKQNNNKKTKLIAISSIIVIIALGIGVYAIVTYLGIFDKRNDEAGVLTFVDTSQSTSTEESDNENVDFKALVASSELNLKTEIVAEGLEIPWGGVFTSESRLLVTQRPGTVVEITLGENGIEQSRRTIREFSSIQGQNSEEGLMAITLDPDYEQNSLVYVAAAFPADQGFEVDIVRLRDTRNTLIDDTVIVDKIPGARFHAGTQLRFGPDEYLYIATGDGLDANSAQDLNSLGGKVLRVDRDGNPAPGNPFSSTGDARIFAYGLRNPQGFDWSPVNDVLVLNDHGPSGFDGPRGGDEVNVVQAGTNYGWPIVSHSESQEGLQSPALEFTPAVAPGTGTFYSSQNQANSIPEFYNDYFFGGLVGEGLFRVIMNPNNPTQIQALEKVDIESFGRIRAVFQGPDGSLYFTTSNTDGRGEVRGGDDKIIRVKVQ